MAVDFDAAVRDKANATMLRKEYDSGDYLHLNPAGYKAMAAAVDLKLFQKFAGGECHGVKGEPWCFGVGMGEREETTGKKGGRREKGGGGGGRERGWAREGERTAHPRHRWT